MEEVIEGDEVEGKCRIKTSIIECAIRKQNRPEETLLPGYIQKRIKNLPPQGGEVKSNITLQ